MTVTAIYVASWLIAILSVVVGCWFIVPLCVLVCMAVIFYSTRGHRLGI